MSNSRILDVEFLFFFRDPSWRSEEPYRERQRTASGSSQPKGNTFVSLAEKCFLV